MMRGGHLDVCVLGAYQVSAARRPGQLAHRQPGRHPRRRRRDGPGHRRQADVYVMMTLLHQATAAQAGAGVHLPAHRRSPAFPASTPTWPSSTSSRTASPSATCSAIGFARRSPPSSTYRSSTGRGRRPHDPLRNTSTTVGIVGGGPAGLMLSHLLSLAGIDSVVVDNRTRREIENTVRAGILERDSVRLLVESGVSDRVLTRGPRARRHRPSVRRRQPPHRFPRPGGRVGVALPAERRVHRPGRRT